MPHNTPQDPHGSPSRRAVLVSASATLAAAALAAPAAITRAAELQKAVKHGRVRQSVCKWCYGSVSLEDMCVAAKQIGLESVELLGGNDIETVKKHGLECAVVNSHRIERGLNRVEHHEDCLNRIRQGIDEAVMYGCPNVITFSGNRAGMPDDVGLDNCEKALKQIVGYAEEKGVTIIMELLNSKRSHKDYMCDRTHWGVELVKRVGSERFKLLYDIFHMQVQEGDVIDTIKESHPYIAHYHTGGVPGRAEIDETQELYYPAIMRAILETGYKGFVGQEFIPRRDNPLASLAQGVAICDV